VDPQHGYLHGIRAGQDLPRLVVAVADDQTPPLLVLLRHERRDIGVHLGLQRFGEHPRRTHSHDFIDQRRRIILPALVA
jgi:hypothetical protein